MIDAHIVDVSSIKKILSNCTYYDLIIDYEFNYNDKTTIDLINWYKDFIFICNIKIPREEKLLKRLDKCIYKYTVDYNYQKELKRIIEKYNFDLNNSIYNKIIARKIVIFTNKYEDLELLNINSSRWI